MSDSAQVKAELAIAAVLRDLEIETGTIVDRIWIEVIDITSVRDDRQQLLRRVSMDLRPMPGSKWRV